ncbi:MAG TPA: TonB-dependent receptor [Brevundimonas sp.]|jgi:iron complex outermembrane receptor protein|uniref:TonB-dependent receptor n=1 Tax=Brevundimonas sp. TaxID=1871086 RepID=UPI002DEFE878|nr:TonB-dependent receptor [Brevundimonas sp.]
MMNRKRVFWATTALFTGLLAAGAASAQSSGTEAIEATEVEEVVVTGRRGPVNIEGVIVAETVAKTRSTITQEFIARQNPGQTVVQSLNLVPGLNFTNTDPYGASGGNLRLRGFDGNRVSLTFDGLPLNDTGNYAVYTNQQLDPELIDNASVNQGTTDVDSPTASAVGGTINYRTARPYQEPGVETTVSAGEYDFQRVFVRADTGAFGPWGTTAYVSASHQEYSKFKGYGDLQRQQFNGRIYQDMGNGNFASLGAHYNENRNASYNSLTTLAQFDAGTFVENDIACVRPSGVNGTVQDENTQSTQLRYDGTVASGSCTNATDLRINPSNTGNVRGQFSYGLTDSLRFTFDPSYQYTLATGGTTFSVLNERDDRLDQNSANNNSATGLSAITNAQCATAAFRTTGVDLNGDGDSCDNVHVYAPSITNTNRYGLTSSLIWDLNEDHRFRVAYTLDYGRHRQTGEGSFMKQFAEPLHIWSSSPRGGDPSIAVLGRDGSLYRFRDRRSIAELNQYAAEYRGQFFDDALTINIGVRAPFFERQLNQFCYSQNGSSTVRCTTETPAGTFANGNVRFQSTGTTQWIAPYSQTIEFEDVLPNVGATWRFADQHTVYASYAEGISVPRTDNLYQPVRAADGSLDFSNVQPELTKSYDLGYRFRSASIIGSIALWYTDYDNRIVQSFDNNLFLEDGVTPNPFFGISVDRNVGAVKQQGMDAQVGWEVSDSLTLYASASYNDSEIQEDLALSATTALPLAGKRLVETPEWTYAARVEWTPIQNLDLGLQAKYVSERFSTDVNDEVFPEYTVVDMDARYDLTEAFGIKNAFVQFNVTNLFDEKYLGNISTGNNATTIDVDPGPGVVNRTGQARTGSLGAPRTAVFSIGTRF